MTASWARGWAVSRCGTTGGAVPPPCSCTAAGTTWRRGSRSSRGCGTACGWWPWTCGGTAGRCWSPRTPSSTGGTSARSWPGSGLRRPVLVGHSLGGYAATAFAASGGACAAVVAVDGFVPDPRERVEQETALRDQAEWERSLWEAFRYGWRASEAELAEHLRSRPDPLGLYQGVDPAAVTALLRRSFVPDGAGGWLRRPTMDEIRRLSRAPEGEIYPSVEVYDRVTVPMLLVMASQGFYWTRYEQMARVAAAGGNRRLVTVEGGHNLVMQQPERLAEVVVDFVSSLPALVSED
nr:hypothetical protein GCM10020241_53280 [Streptoalloteichus tenebrarius]